MTKRTQYRRAARIDANQPPTVNLLRATGWSVLVTSSLGGGAADLVAASDGFTALVELKNREGGGTRLTIDEQAFSNTWKGVYIIADSPGDALSQLEQAKRKGRDANQAAS